MLGMPDSDCSPTVQTACGHVKSEHTPHDFLDSLGDFYRIGGFLTDSRTPDQRLKTIFVGNAESDPITLPWTYTVGESKRKRVVHGAFHRSASASLVSDSTRWAL